MTYLLMQLAGARRCWARRIAKKHLNLGFIGAQIRWLRSYGSAHGNVEKPRNQIDIAVKQFKQIVDHPVLIKNACCQSGNSHSLRLDFKILLFFYLVFNGFFFRNSRNRRFLFLLLGPAFLRSLSLGRTQTEVVIIGHELPIFNRAEIVASVLHLARRVLPLVTEVHIRNLLNHLNIGAFREALNAGTIESHDGLNWEFARV